MTNILTRIAASFRSGFAPSDPDEYFALRLAHKLGEPEMARHYRLLAAEHAKANLVAAFNRSLEAVSQTANLARHFHAELPKVARPDNLIDHRLVALRIERRSVAAAIFHGPHLETVRVRHLSSKPEKAQASVTGFVRSVSREFRVESVALESVPHHQEIHRAVLADLVKKQIRSEGISLWEVSKKSVLASFAHPEPKTRTEVRRIVAAIWPNLSQSREERPVLDAIALGLFIQTERLFNHLESRSL